jgi:hypothetical protein
LPARCQIHRDGIQGSGSVCAMNKYLTRYSDNDINSVWRRNPSHQGRYGASLVS